VAKKRKHDMLIAEAHDYIVNKIAKVDQSSPSTILIDMINTYNYTYNDIYIKLQANQTNLTIVANAIQLILSLPSHSHFRKPLLAYLSNNIDLAQASKIFHVSIPIMRAALNNDYNANDTDLFAKYSHDVTREKIKETEKQLITLYITNSCPVKSGSKYIRYKQYDTDKNLYQEYIDNFEHMIQQVYLYLYLHLHLYLYRYLY
jgi:hypothetical protein